MSREWRSTRDQWEIARITDGQFISQSEAMGPHHGALAREIVGRDFGETMASVGSIESATRIWG
jgi:hypothetical protein